MPGSAVTTISGVVAMQPELNYTQNGTAILKIKVVTQYWDGKGNVDQWYTITLWDKQAENMSPIIHKGTALSVAGTSIARPYLDRDKKPQCSYELKPFLGTLSLHKDFGRAAGVKAGAIPDDLPPDVLAEMDASQAPM